MLDLKQLREAVRENRYVVKALAKQRMGQRKIRDADIRSIILNGEIVEQTQTLSKVPDNGVRAR